jgi:hypothetical protein
MKKIEEFAAETVAKSNETLRIFRSTMEEAQAALAAYEKAQAASREAMDATQAVIATAKELIDNDGIFDQEVFDALDIAKAKMAATAEAEAAARAAFEDAVGRIRAA